MVQLDIPMPKTCYECPCHDGENNSCQVTGKYYYDEILRSCPLIELPSAQFDRDIPKKPGETTDRSWGIPHRQAVCPNCDCYLVDVYFIDGSKRKVTYCESCGQAIDWEGWEEDE